MGSAFFLSGGLRRIGRCRFRLCGSRCCRSRFCRRYGLSHPGSGFGFCRGRFHRRFLGLAHRGRGALQILLFNFIGGCRGLGGIRFLRDRPGGTADHAGAAHQLLLHTGGFCRSRFGHLRCRFRLRLLHLFGSGSFRNFRLLTGLHDPRRSHGILYRGCRFRRDTVRLQFIPGFLPGQNGIFGRKRIRRKGSVRVPSGVQVRMVEYVPEPFGIFFHKRRGENIVRRNGGILRFIQYGIKQKQFIVFFVKTGTIRSIGIQDFSSFLGAN